MPINKHQIIRYQALDKFNDEIDDGELLNFIDKKLEFYNKMNEDKVISLLKAMWFNEIYDARVRGIGK